MNPATATLLTGLASGAAEGASGLFSSRSSSKNAKLAAQEKKRKTLADLLNAALEREFKAGEGQRERGTQLAGARANALQNLASQYVAALARR